MELKFKKLKISVAELVFYILGGLLLLWGLVYLALGFAVNFLPYNHDLCWTDNYLKQTTGNMGFLLQGVVIVISGLIVVVTTLLIAAKGSDREFEKKQRREARMAQRREAFSETTVVENEASQN